jgi:BMFP domain-containing protein YqiC
MRKFFAVQLVGIAALAAIASPRLAHAGPYDCAISGTCVPSTNSYTMGGGTAIEGTYNGGGVAGGGAGVIGLDTGSANGFGVEGGSQNGCGVQGVSDSNVGVFGLVGYASLQAAPTGLYGVYAQATGSSAYGLYATSDGGDSIHAHYTGSTALSAVAGEADSHGTGVYGSTNDSAHQGVKGNNGAGGVGVEGTSSTSGGTGVYGSGSSFGVYGTSAGSFGVKGIDTAGGVGVFGISSLYGGSFATTGTTNSDTAVYAVSGGGSSFAGIFVGDIKVNSTTYSSDARLKQNVQPVADALGTLMKLKGVTFEWREPAKHGNHAEKQIGFIAQEVEKVFPGWVRDDNEGFKTLDVHQVEALEVESIRTLKDKNDALEAKNKALESRLENLETGAHPIAAGFTGGLGISPGNLSVAMLGMIGAFMVSRRKQNEQA